MKLSLFDRFKHWLNDGNIGVLKRHSMKLQRERLIEQGFRECDPIILATLSEKELATFQSKYTEGSRQFILAEYEWQRRLTAQQIKAAYRTAWIGVIGAIVGAVAAIAAQFLSGNKPWFVP
ncbi:MAG: hypothetical protein WC003_16975 [Terrimicrobiaceae bacterium]